MASDALMISGEAIAINGEAVASSTFPVPCCCDACHYYKGIPCTVSNCGTVQLPAVYFQVCPSDMCWPTDGCTQSRPIETGMVVHWGTLCFKIDLSQKYCPPLGRGNTVRSFFRRFFLRLFPPGGPVPGDPSGPPPECAPIPEGATAVPAGDFLIECCKDCGVHPQGHPFYCPPVQGYYIGRLCDCPTNQQSCTRTVYIACQVYDEAVRATGSNCPAWSVLCNNGQNGCFYVRPGDPTITNPDPSGIFITIGTGGAVRNCCACCPSVGSHVECCYSLFEAKRFTWTNGNLVITELGTEECCSRKPDSWAGSSHFTQHFFFPSVGALCLTQEIDVTVNGLDMTTVQKDYGGASAPGTCPSLSNTTVIPELLQECLTGAVFGPRFQPPQNGVYEYHCDRVSWSVTTDNTGSGGAKLTEVGEFHRGGAEGCGSVNCGPAGRPDIVAITGGCGGCGKEGL